MARFANRLACALNGIYCAFESERNLKIQVVAVIPTVILGIYLGLSRLEWCLVILSIGLVLASELFNTAIERLGDLAGDGKQNGLVHLAKDISAGAVLTSAVIAFIIGVIVLFIPLVHRLLG